MRLLKFLQLIHARRDSCFVLSRVGVGNSLAIGVDLINIAGRIPLSHRVISRPPCERLSNVERHGGVAQVCIQELPRPQCDAKEANGIGVADARCKRENKDRAEPETRRDRRGNYITTLSPTWLSLLKLHEPGPAN